MKIYSYYFRMTDPQESGDYHMLAIKLRGLGLHRNHVSKKLATQPLLPNGDSDMWQVGYCWIAANGARVLDWAEHKSKTIRRGYYLELDPGQTPCPPMPESEKPISRTNQAVAWMLAEPDRSQYRAAREFKVSQQAISRELKRRGLGRTDERSILADEWSISPDERY